MWGSAAIKLYGDVACEIHTEVVNELSVNVATEPLVVGHRAVNELAMGRVWLLHEYEVAMAS